MTEQHPFKWRHFQSDLILLCVRWYLRYPVRYRHLARDDARTGLFGRSPHHLSLGAALCPGSGKTVPTSGERNNRLLAQRFKQIAIIDLHYIKCFGGAYVKRQLAGLPDDATLGLASSVTLALLLGSSLFISFVVRTACRGF